MILDEKALLLPPPPYFVPRPPPIDVQHREKPSFSTLPSHILLQILNSLFPQQDGRYHGEGKHALQRKTLHWIHTSLRRVNRTLFIASMHVLRSTYLPMYDSLIRHPYSSDPFPSSHYYEAVTERSIFTHHRELPTLDLFIAVLTHEDVLHDSTELHLPREEAYKDIFDLIQPRSRLEDLIFEQGCRAGVITNSDGDPVPPSPATPRATTIRGRNDSIAKEDLDRTDNPYTFSLTVSPPPSVYNIPVAGPSSPSRISRSFFSFFRSQKPKLPPPTPFIPPPIPEYREIHPLPFSSLSISYSPRRIGLVYTPPPPPSAGRGRQSGIPQPSPYPGGRKRTIVEVSRTKEEPLEVGARRLVRGLKNWLEEQ